jgi:hypothetical protein
MFAFWHGHITVLYAPYRDISLTRSFSIMARIDASLIRVHNEWQ